MLPPRAWVTRRPVLRLPPGALAVRRLGRGLKAPGHLSLRGLRRATFPRSVRRSRVQSSPGAPMAAAGYGLCSRPHAWSARTGTRLKYVRLRHRKVGVSLARYGGVRVVVRVAETIVASLANGVATPIVPVPPWSIGPPQTGPGVRRPRPTFWVMPNAQVTTGSTAHSTAWSSVQPDIMGVDAGLPSVRIRRHRTGSRPFAGWVWVQPPAACAHA